MRKWTYEALYQVIVEGVYSNLYLKKHLQELSEKDQPLATRIFYGTIQNYGYCQYVWSQYIQDQKKISKKVQIVLSMSVYQLLFLERVPRYAIIDEAVTITKQISPKLSGLVNAVLRKVNKKDIVLPQDDMERLSVLTSTPLWLLKMWKAQYGMEKMEQMAKASNQTLPIYVRRNPLLVSKTEFEKEAAMEPYNDLYIYKGNQIFTHPYYKKGWVSIQDEGSYAISQYVDARENETILDVCAAPGTKTMAMAEQMHQTGHIDCLDIHAHRVGLIENEIKRLHIENVSAHVQDACDLKNYGMYDKILCDVPCSGYGVFARKPDIKLRMQPSDMDTLIPVQRAILSSASEHVKEHGILVYSTCTANKKENEKQVEWFLKQNTQFKLLEQKQIFPSEKTDGFYMAKLRREG